MTQVIDIIRDALGHLRVLDADSAPSPSDARDAIRALNQMMRAWEAESLPLGWLDVSSPAQDMPTPPEADEAIGYNLAIRLNARYGQTLETSIIGLATDGKALLSAMATSSTYVRTEYPDLPRGESQPGLYGWRAGFTG
jgi:hypothetical protein